MSCSKLGGPASVKPDIATCRRTGNKSCSEETSSVETLPDSLARSRFSISTSQCAQAFNADDTRTVARYLASYPDSIAWIDCQDFLVSEISEICRPLVDELHPLTLEILKNMSNNDYSEGLQELKAYQFAVISPGCAVIVFKNGILSLSTKQSKFRREIHHVLKSTLAFTPEYILYALVNKLARMKLPVVRKIDKDSCWVNSHVYVEYEECESKSVLDKLGGTRAHTVSLAKQIRREIHVLEQFKHRWAQHDVFHYLEDVKDSLEGMKHRLEAHETLLSHTHRNWMAVTQMHLELKKNRVLVCVGQFLALATVFIPIWTVFTAGHMNLDGPGMAEDDNLGLGRFFTVVFSTVGIASLIAYCSYRYFHSVLLRPPPSLTGKPIDGLKKRDQW